MRTHADVNEMPIRGVAVIAAVLTHRGLAAELH